MYIYASTAVETAAAAAGPLAAASTNAISSYAQRPWMVAPTMLIEARLPSTRSAPQNAALEHVQTG